jgi:hypothetical protein
VLQPENPIIVKVFEEPVKGTTIVDVLVGSLGLTTALLLAAVLLGALLGGVLIGIKLLRARFNLEPVPDSESLRVTPHFGSGSNVPAQRSSSSS